MDGTRLMDEPGLHRSHADILGTMRPAVALDAAGRVIGANPAAIALLGPSWATLTSTDVVARAGGAWTLSDASTSADAPARMRMIQQDADEISVLDAANKGRLARYVAHDVNNLLTCIVASSMPRTGAHDGPEDLAAIHEAAQACGALMRVLLDIDASSSTSADVAEIVGWCSVLLGRLGRRAGVLLVAGCEPLVAAVPAHELQQILINLGVNAIDAMPAGGTLELSAHGDGSSICVVVADTGRGMTTEELAEVFIPGVSSKPGHGGIGLAVVHAIAARHGGRVDVTSQPSVGTRFSVVLPRGPDLPGAR